MELVGTVQSKISVPSGSEATSIDQQLNVAAKSSNGWSIRREALQKLAANSAEISSEDRQKLIEGLIKLVQEHGNNAVRRDACLALGVVVGLSASCSLVSDEKQLTDVCELLLSWANNYASSACAEACKALGSFGPFFLNKNTNKREEIVIALTGVLCRFHNKTANIGWREAYDALHALLSKDIDFNESEKSRIHAVLLSGIENQENNRNSDIRVATFKALSVCKFANDLDTDFVLPAQVQFGMTDDNLMVREAAYQAWQQLLEPFLLELPDKKQYSMYVNNMICMAVKDRHIKAFQWLLDEKGFTVPVDAVEPIVEMLCAEVVLSSLDENWWWPMVVLCRLDVSVAAPEKQRELISVLLDRIDKPEIIYLGMLIILLPKVAESNKPLISSVLDKLQGDTLNKLENMAMALFDQECGAFKLLRQFLTQKYTA